jgi:phosphate:Na+ symporter
MEFFEVLALFGGLGLFLYGMKLMSDSLEAAAGDKLRKGLETLTSNRFAAVGLGAGVTAIIQSSSATTVMLIGFVNAGLMTMSQAIFVGMGANIGTTMTAQMIAFKITSLAPAILFAGIIMMLFFKRRNVRRIGQIIGGLGILFVGMNIMSQAVIPLKEWQPFLDLLSSFSSPLTGLLAGVLVTMVIQSSSATMGIMQAFALQGIVGLDSAVYVILGLNLGTCITAILASLSGGKTAKRTAVSFLFFNIIGVAVFAVLLAIFPIVDWVKSWTPEDTVRQLANFHTFFNITTTAILIGFPLVLVRASYFIIRGEDKKKSRSQLKFIDKDNISLPAVGVGQSINEVIRVAEFSLENFNNSLIAFINRKEKLAREVVENEQVVDNLSQSIMEYLTNLAQLEMSAVDSRIVMQLMKIIIDLERISDHSENIAQSAIRRIDKSISFSKSAIAEVELISSHVKDALTLAVTSLKNKDRQAAEDVLKIEPKVDKLEKKFTKSHLKRLSKGECNPSSSAIYTDIIHNMERVCDHCTNIANEILQGDIFTK